MGRSARRSAARPACATPLAAPGLADPSSTSPRRAASRAISMRDAAPSLPLMFATWTEAVFLLMTRASAISPSERPAVMSASTSRSRADNGSIVSGTTRSARWRASWNATTSFATVASDARRRLRSRAAASTAAGQRSLPSDSPGSIGARRGLHATLDDGPAASHRVTARADVTVSSDPIQRWAITRMIASAARAVP